MESQEVGIREFREKLADYLEGGKPLAITKHGQTLGFYVPVKKRDREADLAKMRAAAEKVDAMIASWGVTEDELMAEVEEMRRAERQKKRAG